MSEGGRWWNEEGTGRNRRDGERDDGGRDGDDEEETERMTKWKGFVGVMNVGVIVVKFMTMMAMICCVVAE